MASITSQIAAAANKLEQAVIAFREVPGGDLQDMRVQLDRVQALERELSFSLIAAAEAAQSPDGST
jgi:hypothetical protein